MNYYFNRMSSESFVSALDINNNVLKTRWNCEMKSFRNISGENRKDMPKIANANLRKDIFKPGQKGRDILNSLNSRYDEDLARFQDIIIPWVIPNQGAAEPTALVTEDGSRMDLWYTGGYTYTVDGVHYAPVQQFRFVQTDTDYQNLWCLQFFRKDGYVYCISVCSEIKWLLWRSSDNINFTFVQVLFTPSLGLTNLGNTFLFTDNGKWYFIYEAQRQTGYPEGYRIYIAQSDNFEGPYVNMIDTPIIEGTKNVGNPELATVDNRVYKYNGRYYMFYHFHDEITTGVPIFRATSRDLVNWDIEGPMLEVKKQPENPLWTNGDQCICEFKGHTYMFYTNNANAYITGDDGHLTHLDVCVDFRPLSELLKLKP